MGKSKSHSLLKLGLKRVPKRHFINAGFGNGYYVFRTQKADSKIVEVREYSSGEVLEVPVKTLSLNDMGLQRTKSGRVIPKNKVI